jgi:hypothetical protein
MTEAENLLNIKDVINRTYLCNNNSIVPDSIDARFLVEILTIYMEYDTRIYIVLEDQNSNPFGSEEYNLCEAKLYEVLDERDNKIKCIFKIWVDTEIIDIYTAFKVRKMPEDSIKHAPFVALLENLRNMLNACYINCVDSKMRGYLSSFREIYKIIGYDTNSYENYTDQVIYEKFNA